MDIESYRQYKRKYELEKGGAEAELAETKPNFESIDPAIWQDYAENFRCWDMLKPHQKRQLLGAIAPVFEVVGTKGEKYNTVDITVKGCRMNLTGKTIDPIEEQACPASQNMAEIESSPNTTLMYLGRHYESQPIYIDFNVLAEQNVSRAHV